MTVVTALCKTMWKTTNQGDINLNGTTRGTPRFGWAYMSSVANKDPHFSRPRPISVFCCTAGGSNPVPAFNIALSSDIVPMLFDVGPPSETVGQHQNNIGCPLSNIRYPLGVQKSIDCLAAGLLYRRIAEHRDILEASHVIPGTFEFQPRTARILKPK